MKITNRKQTTKYVTPSKSGISEYYIYKNGDKSYRDKSSYEHLFRFIDGEWIELTKGVKASYVFSYSNGDWEYIDKDGYFHKFNKDNELIKKYY